MTTETRILERHRISSLDRHVCVTEAAVTAEKRTVTLNIPFNEYPLQVGATNHGLISIS